ncbi:MAG TPA: hypothetical protein DDY04_04970 [Bacteroidales bacterium]|nr:hypothetical protein [Bacteroidales bacterium]
MCIFGSHAMKETFRRGLNDYNQQIEALLSKRKNQPSRISIAEMPGDQRYNKLLQESKKLKNSIIILSYRAESALYNIMPEFYKSTPKEGRVILKKRYLPAMLIWFLIIKTIP